MKQILSIIAMLAVATLAYSADTVRFPSGVAVNSALGSTGFGTNVLAVNGLYTTSITNGLTAQTNLVALTSGSGKPVSIQFTAAATIASVSNVVFNLTSATAT